MKIANREAVIEHSRIVSASTSLAYRRVYRDGVISLQNIGSKPAKLLALWMMDIHSYSGESQFTLSLEPGESLEFDAPRNGRMDRFLDTLVIDHISGGDVEVTCAVPSEILN